MGCFVYLFCGCLFGCEVGCILVVLVVGLNYWLIVVGVGVFLGDWWVCVVQVGIGKCVGGVCYVIFIECVGVVCSFGYDEIFCLVVLFQVVGWCLLVGDFEIYIVC